MAHTVLVDCVDCRREDDVVLTCGDLKKETDIPQLAPLWRLSRRRPLSENRIVGVFEIVRVAEKIASNKSHEPQIAARGLEYSLYFEPAGLIQDVEAELVERKKQIARIRRVRSRRLPGRRHRN